MSAPGSPLGPLSVPRGRIAGVNSYLKDAAASGDRRREWASRPEDLGRLFLERANSGDVDHGRHHPVGIEDGREHPDLLIGTMEQATGNRSATSALVCVPARRSSKRRSSWTGLSLGCLPEIRPVDLATFKPSHVLNLVRSDSNSAIMARMLNSNRATGSVRSCTELADLQLHAGSGEFSSPMSRASGR